MKISPWARLRVDSRKWLLARMLPKLYGDRVVQEHVGRDGGAIEVKAQVNEFMQRLTMISARRNELEGIMREAEDQKTIGHDEP